MQDATVRQLQIFAEVARQLSFSRASQALRLTQPAVREGILIALRRRIPDLSDPRLGSDPEVAWAPWPARSILRATGSLEYLDCAVADRAGLD